MTLLELVELWGERYGLQRKETVELMEHAWSYVEGEPFALPRQVSPGLASKIGVDSAKEAGRRVVAERLLGDPEVLGRRSATPVVWEPESVPRSPVPIPPPVVKVRAKIRCSLCRGEGHTLRTCPTIARPSGIVKGTGGSR